MAEANEKRKSAPTEKMIAAAKAAAERHDVKLPKDFDTDFEVCKKFLDEYLTKPSPKALSFAEKIAKDKGLTIPDEARVNAKELSAWIDANK
ncbi:hypothetical protein [Burkholderia ubonensis]|uniref:hypothetical protein n=1 Tax=Burkholderia ubonensis TaxID=101571 RepID=UPI0007537A59|nr:hypothetical protein [Burkholderia ubonensis]KVP40082.1 hypothetical protein WJ87_07825 [Burkholderia ubonensis]